MTDASYVAVGYALTMLTLGGYGVSLLWRARRARRHIDEEMGRR